MPGVGGGRPGQEQHAVVLGVLGEAREPVGDMHHPVAVGRHKLGEQTSSGRVRLPHDVVEENGTDTA